MKGLSARKVRLREGLIGRKQFSARKFCRADKTKPQEMIVWWNIIVVRKIMCS
jgi:hypothetical protein